MSLAHLAQAAVALVPPTGRAILGIAGVPGAGKSTLAQALVEAANEQQGTDWAAHVPMDGFHLADVQLDRLGLRDRKGAAETFDPAGYAALLRRLRTETDRAVYAPGFERDLEQPIAAAMVVLPNTRLVVTEGNYLLLREPSWREARAALDQVWFVESEETPRVERLIARHIEFGKSPHRAAEWVTNVDELNSHRIRAEGTTPDRIVLNAPDGWKFQN